MEAESKHASCSPRSALSGPAISVVAPCHNEQDNLDELERRVSAACRAAGSRSYEIVLVNDGSKDRTWEVIERLCREKPGIVGVNLSRNHGHQMALTAGLHQASGERILIIDADLQDPPELLGEMMALMDQGADVVYGVRRKRVGDSALRAKTSSVFYRLLSSLTDVNIPVDTGDFRCISRRVLDQFIAMPEQHRFIRGMISWIGFRQVPVVYDRDPRIRGTSSYTLGRLFRFAIDAITGFSVRPLKLATMMGIALIIPSLGFLAYSMFLWLEGEMPVAGWLSIITVQTLFNSLVLLVLGVMGEYVGRIFQEVKGRPLYIVDTLAHSDKPVPDPLPPLK